MKTKLDCKCFLKWLESLQLDKYTELYIANETTGDVWSNSFRKIEFNCSQIILYEDLMGTVSILQDSPVAPWEDMVSDLYDAFTSKGENVLYSVN